MRRNRTIRRGSTTVEVAIIGPATFILVMGLMIGGLGVFRYQQVARVANDAARWASVHGTLYASATNQPAATALDVYNNAIVPAATGLDLSKLTYSVTWNTSNSPSHTVVQSGTTINVANTVTVTINYQWMPQAFVGQQNMSCTSVRVMTN
ncbi:MAG TPA: TadE/TadG family type IV pilus assembly protein [Pirellulales bacterium]|nr:TadE/TadG family type IV pilus assembly protein [Pirellulales bacterium]